MILNQQKIYFQRLIGRCIDRVIVFIVELPVKLAYGDFICRLNYLCQFFSPK